MAGTAVLAVRLTGDAGQLATPIEQLVQWAMGLCCDAGKQMNGHQESVLGSWASERMEGKLCTGVQSVPTVWTRRATPSPPLKILEEAGPSKKTALKPPQWATSCFKKRNLF